MGARTLKSRPPDDKAVCAERADTIEVSVCQSGGIEKIGLPALKGFGQGVRWTDCVPKGIVFGFSDDRVGFHHEPGHNRERGCGSSDGLISCKNKFGACFHSRTQKTSGSLSALSIFIDPSARTASTSITLI
jgi:hypothetical protein